MIRNGFKRRLKDSRSRLFNRILQQAEQVGLNDKSVSDTCPPQATTRLVGGDSQIKASEKSKINVIASLDVVYRDEVPQYGIPYSGTISLFCLN